MNDTINVIKRDGTVQIWDFSKIVAAVKKAFNAAGQEPTDKFLEQLEHEFMPYVAKGKDLNVEQIHNIVRDLFIKKNKFEVVDKFIRWRKEREEIRESKSDLVNDVHKALCATDIQNQNANVDEASFGGRIGEAARVVCKKEALRTMRKQTRKNHENNEIYTHDLDSWSAGMHNCLSVPFDHLLKNGFKTRQCNVRGANSINTAFQLVAVLFQLQSLQQFGGVSATHLDWTMVPYVRKSFFKHYVDGLKYVANKNPRKINNFISTYFTDGKLIPITKFKNWLYKVLNIFEKQQKDVQKRKIEDIEIDNKIYTSNKKAYKYALDKTEKEIYQAVEGFYHNLNTLQLTNMAA